MVQWRQHPTQQDCYSRDNWQQPQDARYGSLSMRPTAAQHPRQMSVVDSLRHCARIPVKDFALLAVLESGEEKIYSSTKVSNDEIFTTRAWQEFHEGIQRTTGRPINVYSNDSPVQSSDHDLDSGSQGAGNYSSSGASSTERSRRRRHQQHQMSRSDDSDNDLVHARKRRARPIGHRYDEVEHTPVPPPLIKAKAITIGDVDAVDQFYGARFKDMQQSACKILGKVFVKLLEPKKQTNYPYTKLEAGAPPWWPCDMPRNNLKFVRHKEPDHLLRQERIALLVHILKIVVEPIANQPQNIRKLNLNVQRLEEVANEAMTHWYSSSENPLNAEKRPFLKEIFTVARMEQRYKAGEVDATTLVHVAHAGGSCEDVVDDEPDEGDRYEDDHEYSTTGSAAMSTGKAPSEGLVSPTMLQTQPELEVTLAQYQNSNRTRRAPPRFSPQSQMEDQQPQFSDTSLYPRVMPGQFPQSSISQEVERRNFGSPEFSSPQSIYGVWNPQVSNIASNGPMTPSYYTTTPHPSVGQNQQQQYTLPPPGIQAMLPSPIAMSYDGLPNGRPFIAGQGQLRAGCNGNPHQVPQQHYSNYVNDGSMYSNNHEDLKDGHHGER